MFHLEIHTDQFPCEPEGPLDDCPGFPGSRMPGSHFAGWIKDCLETNAIKCQKVMQEDYGWGFFVLIDKLNVWVAVSYFGKPQGQLAIWHILVYHKPGSHVMQWFRRESGKRAAADIYRQVLTLIKAQVTGDLVDADGV